MPIHSKGDSLNPSPLSDNPQVKSQRALQGLLAIIIVLPLCGTLYQAIATEMDKRNYLAPGQMIDVAAIVFISTA
jgi:hypothetical protein